MATDNKSNKETVVKPVGSLNVEGKSPMELEALKNGAVVNPEKVIVDLVSEKANENLQNGTLAVNVSVSKETIVDHLLGEDKPGEVVKVEPKVQEDIAQAAGIVGAIVGLIQNNGHDAKAKELMQAQNLNEIWRCPNSGYFFSRKDYAEDYERKNKCSLEHYKK